MILIKRWVHLLATNGEARDYANVMTYETWSPLPFPSDINVPSFKLLQKNIASLQGLIRMQTIYLLDCTPANALTTPFKTTSFCFALRMNSVMAPEHGFFAFGSAVSSFWVQG